MTTKRLEELARKAQASADDKETAIEAYLSDSDLADLARCARAWATLERRENCELFAYPGRDNKWSFYPDLKHTWLRVPAPTAIEAVEAAEVGK